jgi:hypothetical protein
LKFHFEYDSDSPPGSMNAPYSSFAIPHHTRAYEQPSLGQAAPELVPPN